MIRMFGALVALFCCLGFANGRDNGQWDKITPEISAWYRSLMQPDNPGYSCCGEADAYYADSFAVQGDQYVAIITDERPMCDGTQKAVEDGCVGGRPHIAPGTRIVVPNNKMKYDKGNPTGHGIIFVAPQYEEEGGPVFHAVYCYIVPGGG